MTAGAFDFDAPVIAGDTFISREAAKFFEYHATNPIVFAFLKKFGLEFIRAGRTRLGISLLWERVRWEVSVVIVPQEDAGEEYRLPNEYRAWYARLLMQEVPELRGLFKMRKSKADAYFTIPKGDDNGR